MSQSEELVDADAQRQARRENARRIMRESDLPSLLRRLDRELLKGRGRFEEYDTLVLLKWGSGYTGRHIWVEVVEDTIRFRLTPHRVCSTQVPLCDGEYHIFTPAMWRDRALLWSELQKYYARPVAESSSD
ncbi:MAG: hypothetical protein IMW90_06395 [Thermogemmatispora sp.]|jgi:hypothetical protein|uniref:DUF5655 domain-containing protein n=1 Tax=Thermogemmatispora aurantia TaxID=2045279 RepID=A0A5J4JV11_9CHLR|nr:MULTISPECIES: hypothetical protein [Thermogemmatispora]MBE3565343.1 hypothetical protein [Thermogemmatispora sp.]GER81578.1 hypothetical protein KTAU_02160 [Thermogemmatispora aurantia]